MAYTVCDNCGGELPSGRRKYCSDRCMNTANTRRYRRRQRDDEPDTGPERKINKTSSAPDPQMTTDSPVYRDMQAGGWFEALATDDDLTQTEVAGILNVTQGAISKAVARWKDEVKNGRAAADFDLHDNGIGPAPELVLENVAELNKHFIRFRTKTFLQPNGQPYLMPKHQQRWLMSILTAMCRGGKQLILSPPRHGKTELLAHVCVWLIVCINPNIRIMMIGGNQDIAKNTVGLVKDILTDSETVAQDWLKPGQEFQPHRRSGKSWNAEEFTVATRTVAGIKSPTMVALGRGARILSRDADLILVDDIDDDDSTWTPSSREKTRNWWGITVMSRKEEHTAVVVIGSRQHPDDIYNYLLADPGWQTTVEMAHNEADCVVEPIHERAGIWECACEEGEANLHDDDCVFDLHQDCVLWPAVRAFSWLAEKRNGAESSHTFPMVYLNEPTDDDLVTFSREDVDNSRDKRDVGEIPDHEPHYRLIAGLDPSGSGYQAAFLWAFFPATNERYALDVNNRLGGGIARAREQIRKWYVDYGCTHWVIEVNLYHGGIIQDEMLRKYTQQNGIALYPHQTGTNKWEKDLGVSKLADWMQADKLWIPWGTPRAKQRFAPYRKQLINFSNDSRSRAGTTDIVMASWFPEKRMQQWRREWLASAKKGRQETTDYPFAMTEYQFAS